MTTSTIGGIGTSATSLAGADLFEIEQGGTSKKITGALVGDLAASRLHPGFLSANWYGPAGSTVSFNSNTGADLLYSIPIIVPFACTITDLGIYVGTGAGSTNVKLALYNSVAGVPSALLSTVAAQATTASAAAASGALAVAQAVSAGLYWAAALFNGAPSVAQVAGDPILAALMGADTIAHATPAAGATVTGYTGTGTYSGGFNSTFASPARRYAPTPAICFKIQ